MEQTHRPAPETVPLPRRRPETAPAADAGNAALASAIGEQPAETGLLEGVAEGLVAEDRTPVFAGYEDDRYQQHDALIESLVDRFNLDKGGFIGATAEQAEAIADLDPALVKSWLIQETGGGDRRSRAAWDTDPAQVNVPGDWGPEKADAWMNLSEPRRRNEGDLDTNLQAAIVYLARKGFSTAGRAPQDLEGGQTFGGWQEALERYNGRSTRMSGRRPYREVYAEQIVDRAASPDTHHPIQLR